MTGSPAVTLYPLGGLGEIGLNCMALVSGDSMIVVDCGRASSALLGAPEHEEVDSIALGRASAWGDCRDSFGESGQVVDVHGFSS